MPRQMDGDAARLHQSLPQGRAERAADRLLARPGVREARVIVLARGKSR
ncbi:MAG TPA: hypothetical protein VFV33_16805 [Gemmatimonadaceae bacterium]|nr:hypothetical protein [Gemmatimonadaceae bacterium]